MKPEAIGVLLLAGAIAWWILREDDPPAAEPEREPQNELVSAGIVATRTAPSSSSGPRASRSPAVTLPAAKAAVVNLPRAPVIGGRTVAAAVASPALRLEARTRRALPTSPLRVGGG